MVPDQGDSVWGAVWSLDIEDRDHLDEYVSKNNAQHCGITAGLMDAVDLSRQESVSSGLYDVFNATVLTPDGEVLHCRSYLMRLVPPKLQPGESRPPERQPSLVYKKVIVTGARESGLPADYVARVEAVADNGSAGSSPPISLESLEAAPEAPKDADVAAPAAR